MTESGWQPHYLLIALLLLIAIPMCYYLYVGIKAFRIESRDFLPTPYHASQATQQAFQAITGMARVVHWELPDSGTQQAYYLPPANGTVLTYLHGSPGNGAGFHAMIEEMAADGFGALVIDLPGYGASEGARSWGRHYIASVQAGLDFLEIQPGVDPHRLLLLGYSQGACIASRTAAADPRVAGLVIMAGYTNLRDQLHYQFRWRLPGIGLFAIAAARSAGVEVAQMDSLAALSALGERRLLVISGTEDHGISTDMAQTLAAAVENGELWLVSGANHIDIPDVAGPEFYRRIADFAEQVAGDADRHTGKNEHV